MLYERRGCLFFVFSHIRQLKIKLNECELNPYVVSLAIKRSCLMQPKALDRSTNSAPPKPPLSKASFHFSTITSRHVAYHNLGKNRIGI